MFGRYITLDHLTSGRESMLNGLPLYESRFMTEAGEPYEVRRTWKERLFTRPWRPFKATKMIVPQVPQKEILVWRGAGGLAMIMHPVVASNLRKLMRSFEVSK